MGKETVLMKSELRQSLASTADFLRELADQVAAGELVLRQGEQELIFALPAEIVLEIKAEEEQKGKRQQKSLEVELEWYENGPTGIELG